MCLYAYQRLPPPNYWLLFTLGGCWVFIRVPATYLVFLVLLNEDELSGLQPFPAFLRGITRPLGRILAGGLAVVVVSGEIEVSTHTDSYKAVVGLERPSVLVDKVVLVGNWTPSARAGKVAYIADCTQLGHKD